MVSTRKPLEFLVFNTLRPEYPSGLILNINVCVQPHCQRRVRKSQGSMPPPCKLVYLTPVTTGAAIDSHRAILTKMIGLKTVAGYDCR